MLFKKSFLLNLVLVLISSSVSLILAETILRAIYPSPHKNEVRCLEYQHSWVFNTEGFRDDEFDQKLKKGRENILLLGDSFVVGLGTEKDKNFASLLSKKIGSRAEIFNLGKCDTGTVEQSHILSQYIDRIKPKIVVLFFMVMTLETISKNRALLMDCFLTPGTWRIKNICLIF